MCTMWKPICGWYQRTKHATTSPVALSFLFGCRMTKPVCACYSESMHERERENETEKPINQREVPQPWQHFQTKWGTQALLNKHRQQGRWKKHLKSTFPNWCPSKLVPYQNRCRPDPSFCPVEPRKCHWIF